MKVFFFVVLFLTPAAAVVVGAQAAPSVPHNHKDGGLWTYGDFTRSHDILFEIGEDDVFRPKPGITAEDIGRSAWEQGRQCNEQLGELRDQVGICYATCTVPSVHGKLKPGGSLQMRGGQGGVVTACTELPTKGGDIVFTVGSSGGDCHGKEVPKFDGDVIFKGSGGREILRLRHDGAFSVDGEEIAKDTHVVDAFVKFLASTTIKAKPAPASNGGPVHLR